MKLRLSSETKSRERDKSKDRDKSHSKKKRSKDRSANQQGKPNSSIITSLDEFNKNMSYRKKSAVK